MGKIEKLRRILACPECHSKHLQYGASDVTCGDCGSTYPVIHGAPFLLKRNSPVREWYLTDVEAYQAQPVKNKIKNLLKTPEDYDLCAFT